MSQPNHFRSLIQGGTSSFSTQFSARLISRVSCIACSAYHPRKNRTIKEL